MATGSPVFATAGGGSVAAAAREGREREVRVGKQVCGAISLSDDIRINAGDYIVEQKF
jgi:hypothetical protein